MSDTATITRQWTQEEWQRMNELIWGYMPNEGNAKTATGAGAARPFPARGFQKILDKRAD